MTIVKTEQAFEYEKREEGFITRMLSKGFEREEILDLFRMYKGDDEKTEKLLVDLREPKENSIPLV
jgi:hypothetical protein